MQLTYGTVCNHAKGRFTMILGAGLQSVKPDEYVRVAYAYELLDRERDFRRAPRAARRLLHSHGYPLPGMSFAGRLMQTQSAGSFSSRARLRPGTRQHTRAPAGSSRSGCSR